MKKSNRRWSFSEAKRHFAEVLLSIEDNPVVIHRRGRDAAVILSIQAYERLRAKAEDRPVAAWLARLEEWRRRTGGIDFDPAPMVFEPPTA
jgi:prevent-host-death family protein